MASVRGGGEVEVKEVFIGAGCNRIVNNVSWGACDLVAFGAQNAVAIFSPKSAQILTTLPGHNASVNCTHWLPSNKFAFRAKHLNCHYLLSGDSDGAIHLWELSLLNQKELYGNETSLKGGLVGRRLGSPKYAPLEISDSKSRWRNVLQLPKSHKKGITCITAHVISETVAIVASASSDGSICVWEVTFPSTNEGDCTLVLLDSLLVGSKSMVALSLAELPGNDNHMVLAMGGLDNKIHLYCGKRTGEFVKACELKGHTDWIRSLDFSLPMHKNGEASNIMLVSSSQDRGIRIWKMALHGSLTDVNGGCRNEKISLTSYIQGPIFTAGSSTYQVSLESLLIGHEDWVYSVQWQPPSAAETDGVPCYQSESILSASMDKTMMIWKPEKTSGIWMNVVTVGELSHCALGFYGGHWSPNGDSILAHGYGGSFHLWRNVGISSDNWKPQKVPSGHFAPVMDISWARFGDYIISVSHDQTTRIFAPWKNVNSLEGGSWHEIARPQVHGHDINCVTIIQGKGNHRFVSGAEEKVARVFEAPLSFLKTMSHATLQNFVVTEDHLMDVQILGANMSALGLSQKPIFSHSADKTLAGGGNEGLDTLETIPDAVPVVLTEPPIEDQLAWHTLWPESHKLYGHGNELFSLCCDHKGKLVASSCKAQTASVAEIWLWEVGSWKAVGRLQSHSLTITQMEFSHDDSMLLSVSRDRQFSVFKIQRTGSDEIHHELLSRQEAHRRIIWSCSWNPHGHEFATGSRDKTVKIWTVTSDSSVRQLATLSQFKSSITALSWVGLDPKSSGLLAVGMESGLLELWSLSIKRTDNVSSNVVASVVIRLDPFVCHVSSVNRLSWREPEKNEECRKLELASCGADHCVRVFEVSV